MSRSLGYKARHKAAHAAVAPQAKGEQAFKDGVPLSANPWGNASGKGKGHAWARGWKRARQEAGRHD